ncbi:MAG: FtsX-like permease family protein, partial [Aquabacterium sp.]|uniref:ABC transporter permease n=1 Tax=Aquabacterium sp. TaxID=1872578 RepID=UPI003BAF1330
STENSAGIIPDSTLEKVRSIEGVAGASGIIQTISSIVKNGRASKKPEDRLFLSGVDPEATDFSGGTLDAGRDIKTGNEIVLDREFAKKQNVKVGGEIDLAGPAGAERFAVVGLIKFRDGFSFGGQGFARTPIDTARAAFDTPDGFNEIDVETTSDEVATVANVKKKLAANLDEGIEVSTPKDLSDAIVDSLQGFSVFLNFFGAISVFVGGFLILNSFGMTIAQRVREIGMLRTIGASRKQITRSILREALFLGFFGSIAGCLLGLVLSVGLIALVERFGVPFGSVKYPVSAFVSAMAIGVVATVVAAVIPARRAGRISPMEAVNEERRSDRPRLSARLAIGSVLIVVGFAGSYVLAAAQTTPFHVVIAGIGGIFSLFTGTILVAPAIVPWIARALARPMRLLAPVEGRLAADSVTMNARRTAATASILMVGFAMVAAFGSIASSAVKSIKDELDRSFKSDITVQPLGFNEFGGPQQNISPALTKRIAGIDGVETVSPRRSLFIEDGVDGKQTLLSAIDPATRERIDGTRYIGAATGAVYAGMARGGVVVNEGYAEEQKIAVGDKIELDGIAGAREVPVVGLDPTTAQATVGLKVSLELAEEVYGLTNDSVLAIKVTPGADGGRVQKSIESELRDFPQLDVASSSEQKKAIERQQSQGFSFFYALMFVAVLIGVLGVMNTMFISVIERTREVGVLRAIGARRRQIRRMITRESLMITISGVLMGLVVGLILGRVFVTGFSKSSSTFVYAPPIGVIVTSALLSVVFGVLAAVLPARSAAKTNIVEAVSYE